MSVFMETFALPIDREEELMERKARQNGGPLPYLDNAYPCGLFSDSELYEINFKPITILYGGNGSGKSTLLNLIAECLGLERMAPFNSSEMFSIYAEACEFATGWDDMGHPVGIPEGSRIITSDDIFDYMLAVRTNNEDIAEHKEEGKEEWARLRFGDTVKMQGMQDYEAVRLQVMARSKTVSRRKFLKRTAGEEVKLSSNGETALMYFEEKLKNDTLYCLDEPENSLSPAMQLKLREVLEKKAGFGGCQFIIATHSPFLLALSGARIYDLDERPVDMKDWWELENVKLCYRFFRDNRELFE